ncbi:MAG: thioredoxin family protein [Rikenellaceae bacterium]|nr:thioredoxin family protein [Rikenellaceae bacterium]
MRDLKEFMNSDKPVLLDFYAEWCGPCKMTAPVLKDLKSHFGESMHILKIDIDNPKNARMVTEYGIRSVPTLILKINNEIIWRNSGFMNFKDLKEIVNRYITTG